MDILQQVHDLKVSTVIGAVVEAFLQSIYVMTFSASIYHQCKHSKKLNYVVLTTSIMLFCFVTTHWILGIVQLYQAFVVNGTSLLGPALYYSDVKNPLQLTRITLYVGCTVLIDLLLAYRLFVIMERRFWVILPPLVAVCAIIVCFALQMLHYVSAASIMDVLPGGPGAPWVIASYALSFVTSFYPSALILYRIVTDSRSTKSDAPTWEALLPVAFTIIESALFYCALNIVVLSLYLRSSIFVFIIIGINPACIGINFSLIVLRISVISAQHAKRSSQRTSYNPTSQLGSSRSRLSKMSGLGDMPLQLLVPEQGKYDRESKIYSIASAPVSPVSGLGPPSLYSTTRDRRESRAVSTLSVPPSPLLTHHSSIIAPTRSVPPLQLSPVQDYRRTKAASMASPPTSPTPPTFAAQQSAPRSRCVSEAISVPATPSTPPVDPRW